MFADAFDQLLAAVEKSSSYPVAPRVSRQTYTLPQDLAASIKTAKDDWRANGKPGACGTATLRCGRVPMVPIGWVGSGLPKINTQHDNLRKVAEDAKSGGFSSILLLGMGGSSLCPEVLRLTYGKIAGYPDLHVLDSTDPAQIISFEDKIDVAKTLFIVSSKSGSTLEPTMFKQYFFERVKQAVGEDKAGSRFIAITDPGSKMQKVAEADKFRHIFYGLPSIGGRYSALSNFGMVPGAVMGMDSKKFLERTEEMVQACASCVPVEENPGVVLGLILGSAAKAGRDKVTIITSPGIHDLGAWLEQLIAESTGKQGKGIIPVDREAIGAPEMYGNDRVFAYLRLESEPDKEQDAKVSALEKAGHPVVRISLTDTYDLGQEFFRWEIATASRARSWASTPSISRTLKLARS